MAYGNITRIEIEGGTKMAEFTNRLEPEEVRFLMDFSELKDIVTEILGEANTR